MICGRSKVLSSLTSPLKVWYGRHTAVGSKSAGFLLSLAVLSNQSMTDSDSELDVSGNSNFALLLARAVRLFADTPAIVHRETSTTFTELGRRAGAIAEALAGCGVNAGDVCAVLTRVPSDAAAAFFAVLGVGALGTNLNELYRPRQIEFILSHSHARVLLVGRDALEALPRELSINAQILVLEEIAQLEGVFSPVERCGDDGAQITYTSGSTGQPKGVLMSHANLWAGVRVVVNYLGLRSDDRIASVLPFS